jgi:predicted dehydrogenase
MATLLNWGIIGTGGIAHAFARGVAHSKLGRVAAVGSRTQASADTFAAEFGLARAHGSYDALLADDAVSAVYIATPHPQHVEWIARAAQAGKHVLCEKPLGLNRSETLPAVEAWRPRGVLRMESIK